MLVVDTDEETEGDALEELVGHGVIVSDIVCEAEPVYDKVSIAEFDGLEDTVGAEVTVIYEYVGERVGVHVFVTVCRIKVNV